MSTSKEFETRADTPFPGLQERRGETPPFFSLCIPQYNRTSFLLYALERLKTQNCRDFEICISDDCSNDGRADELLAFLDASDMSYAYIRQPHNLRYDANLRASIALAKGRYAWLMGNDDCLATPDTLEKIRKAILQARACPAAVLTNYQEFSSGRLMRRVRRPGEMAGGVGTAVRVFRNVSFISGVILASRDAQQQATSKWDGSEMYQMYLTSRLIARGGGLLNLELVTVLQGIQLPGQTVDSYALKPRLQPCPIVERELTLTQLGRVVWDAVKPSLSPSEYQRMIRTIFLQILILTYPFWLFEYRRVQSWNYAAGVALGMRPRNVLSGVPANLSTRALLSIVYVLISAVGLSAPLFLFDALYPRLYALAKSLFS